MADRIQLRRDTKARWTQYNPILLEGEEGYELDSDQYKIGDGIHAWNDLPYRGAGKRLHGNGSGGHGCCVDYDDGCERFGELRRGLQGRSAGSRPCGPVEAEDLPGTGRDG